MDTQSLVTLAPWTVIAQLCNLAIQIVIFKKLLYNPVMNILKKRQEQADAPLTEAEKLKAEALAIKAEYEQNMALAKEKADQIVQDATQTASQRGERILQDARAEAIALKEQADAEIAQQQKKALNEVKDEISDMAMDIASRIVAREIKAEDHAQFIDDFIRGVGEQA